jgi:hypothetical protein
MVRFHYLGIPVTGKHAAAWNCDSGCKAPDSEVDPIWGLHGGLPVGRPWVAAATLKVRAPIFWR